MTATTETEVTQFCRQHRACREGADWAAQYQTMREVWDNCTRVDWLLWICRHSDVPKNSLVGLSADFAERALPIYEARNAGDTRPRDAIVAARNYAADPSKENRKAAAYAAYAAADAYAAAYAAAADAAAYAADAADAYAAADAARKQERKFQADIVREIINAKF